MIRDIYNHNGILNQPNFSQMDSGNGACPNGCSGNGECNQRDGKCTCEPQFAGKDCSESKCKICYTSYNASAMRRVANRLT